jgi:hypothetical protein
MLTVPENNVSASCSQIGESNLIYFPGSYCSYVTGLTSDYTDLFYNTLILQRRVPES